MDYQGRTVIVQFIGCLEETNLLGYLFNNGKKATLKKIGTVVTM